MLGWLRYNFLSFCRYYWLETLMIKDLMLLGYQVFFILIILTIYYKLNKRKQYLYWFEPILIWTYKGSVRDEHDVCDLVYLSPDATEYLDDLDINKVYVIGGLVDDTVQTQVCINQGFGFITFYSMCSNHLDKESYENWTI